MDFLDTDLSVKQSTSDMSATVMSAINVMCSDAKSQAVKDLADKYGFDVEEAQRFLDIHDSKSQVVKKEPKVKKMKKEKKESDDDKPKRKPTGYLLFSKDQRPAAKLALEADLDEGEKLKPQLVMTELGKMWKALSDEERATWNETASDSD